METWWIRYPNALENEKKALDAAGYTWQMDEAAFNRGRLVLHVDVQYGGETLKVFADYPDTYPYFQPNVTYDGKLLSRHHHPLGRNLCLLAREGEDWTPGTDTLAGLLDEQLPKLLSVNDSDASSEYVAEHEDHIGEPVSSFLEYEHNSAIVVPDETPPSEIASGKLHVMLSELPPHNSLQQTNTPVRGVITRITDLKENTLVDAGTAPPSFQSKHIGYWLRLPERPTLEAIPELATYLFEQFKERAPEAAKTLSAGKRGQLFILGFIWPDERSWRTTSDDWVFLRTEIKQERKKSRPTNFRIRPIRADWGGERAWMQRAPALRPLRSKRVLLIGLGAIGSPVAINLARAGIGHLDLIDHDDIQIGNTIRWALGWSYVGLSKCAALASYITAEYPYTRAFGYNCRIGAPTTPNERFFSDYDLVWSQMKDADIIIDATANFRVSHFLSDLAQDMSIPYLWLTGTHGAAGGVVGRIQPGKTKGCWHCFQHRLADETIRMPADSGGNEIQAGGCSQATFIGAGIDSDEIALLASRLAAATLCTGEVDGYPDFNWDVAVADLQRDGISLAPAWSTYSLDKHTDCTACQTTDK